MIEECKATWVDVIGEGGVRGDSYSLAQCWVSVGPRPRQNWGQLLLSYLLPLPLWQPITWTVPCVVQLYARFHNNRTQLTLPARANSLVRGNHDISLAWTRIAYQQLLFYTRLFNWTVGLAK